MTNLDANGGNDQNQTKALSFHAVSATMGKISRLPRTGTLRTTPTGENYALFPAFFMSGNVTKTRLPNVSFYGPVSGCEHQRASLNVRS